MPVVEEQQQRTNPSISAQFKQVVETNVDMESPVSRERPREQSRDSWQRLIDQKLSQWLRNPAALEDDGVDAPSPTIIRLAIDYAESYRDGGLAPAQSVTPDANGGIVFERRDGNTAEVLHIWSNGSVEYQRFQGTRLIDRRPA